MEHSKGSRKHFHLNNNRKNKRVYDYDHSAILLDPVPPPDEQEIVKVIKGENGTQFPDPTYSVRHEEANFPSSYYCFEPDPATPGQDREVRTSFWKRWVSPSYATVQTTLSAAACGTLAYTRSWWSSVRTKLAWPKWPLQSEQRWMVEIIQCVDSNNDGMQVNYITELECDSKEMAEKYARQWDEKLRLEEYKIPYTIKIFETNGRHLENTLN